MATDYTISIRFIRIGSDNGRRCGERERLAKSLNATGTATECLKLAKQFLKEDAAVFLAEEDI